jgi:hypothetical protein
MVIEEVASAKREVAARKSGTLSRERLREIILEEVAHHKRSRPLQESHDMSITPKLSLVRALLGEADDKGGAAGFADGGPGMLKVGSQKYYVFDGDPKDEPSLPEFNMKVATKVIVKPDAFAAFFPGRGAVSGSKVDFTPGKYNPTSDIDPNLPGSVKELMKVLAEGVAMQYVPMTTKSDAESDLLTLISPEQLERLRRQKREQPNQNEAVDDKDAPIWDEPMF